MATPDAFRALSRFGLGPSAADLPAARNDPRGYVLSQIAAAAPPGGPTTEEGLGAFMQRRAAVRPQADRPAGMEEAGGTFLRPGDALRQEMDALLRRASGTRQPFQERLVQYWTDHFTTTGLANAYLGGPKEREAIWPRMLGPFRDLLIASVLHPSMLTYLDNRNSVGPNAPVNQRARNRRGLNENLGREVLELHSLGVDGGYAQADVIELSKVLTGWTLDLSDQPVLPRRHGFRPEWHEPGPKTILGRTYREEGPEEAVKVLTDLAAHPSTARHVTRRMVRHLVGHGLPGLEARMAEAFRRSDGDLGAVTRALLRDDEAWGPPRKVRPPIELLLASARLFGGLPPRPDAGRALRAMGQPFWAAPSPKGWPDEDEAWGAPDAIKTRLDWAAELAAQLPPGTDARGLLDAAFGPAASAETRQAVARAADGRQALTLLLLSPEFQRR